MNLLEEIEGLVSAKIASIKAMVSLIQLEAKLAGLSVYPLILNVCMLFVVLITLWLCTMLLTGLLLLQWNDNPLLATALVLLINVGFLIGLILYLSYNLRNISFVKTRAYFAKQKRAEHETSTERAYLTDRDDGQKNALPASKSRRVSKQYK